MSEAQPNGTKSKRMVSRNVAIALGIICVILVVGLGVAVVYYTSTIGSVTSDKDSTIASKDNQIASLNNQILHKNYTIWEQNNTISSLETQLATLQEQTKDIHILGTGNSPYFFVINFTAFVEAGPPPTFADSFVANASSGYVVVWVSSNNNSTYVSVAPPVNATDSYYQTINVGSEGIAIFPIPVAPFVDVEVGVSSGTGTVTWTAMYLH
ncbi:MAG: hypothetical protein ABSG57_11885 [Candidatus Bathyarchaeia archaeon]|jgi:hypothetical protein